MTTLLKYLNFLKTQVKNDPGLVLCDSEFLHFRMIAFVMFTIFDSTAIETTSYKTRYTKVTLVME